MIRARKPNLPWMPQDRVNFKAYLPLLLCLNKGSIPMRRDDFVIRQKNCPLDSTIFFEFFVLDFDLARYDAEIGA